MAFATHYFPRREPKEPPRRKGNGHGDRFLHAFLPTVKTLTLSFCKFGVHALYKA
jgi:hypothetical protein